MKSLVLFIKSGIEALSLFKCCIAFLLTITTTVLPNYVYAQSGSVQVTSNQNHGTMSSYLNGIDRNHEVGWTLEHGGRDWLESQYVGKMNRFRDINNNFSNGKKLYRFGHNISDGNFEFRNCGFQVRQPGWHWATEYKTGTNEEAFRIAEANGGTGNLKNSINCNELLGATPTNETFTMRIGSGIHRFLYTYREPDGQYRKFAGFTVTQNYPNDITISHCPNSYSAYIGSNGTYEVPNFNAPSNPNKINAIGMPGDIITIEQVGGPGSYIYNDNCSTYMSVDNVNVGAGNYEMDFRITNNKGQVSYCGFVISVNEPGTNFEIVRTQNDVRVNLSLVGNNPRERHSEVHTLNNFKIASGAAVSDYDENTVYPDLGNQLTTYADQTLAYGYDDITFTLAEIEQLDVDLAVVANVATGYPEEAEGLVEFLEGELQGQGHTIAYVELGNELMGFWVKGSCSVGRTPAILGEKTLPFARIIKENHDVKIATCSFYNWKLDWTDPNSNALDIEQTINETLMPFENVQIPGEYWIDYINIHHYPNNAIKTKPFNDLKVNSFSVLQDRFNKEVLNKVNAVLQDKNVGVVITEFNTAQEDNVINGQRQMWTMTEGIYHAESFMTAAQNKVYALTPFALMKTAVFPSESIALDDPTNSSVTLGGEVDFNILFYPNNNQNNWGWGQNIWYKPTFRVKEMLAENLGSILLPAEVSSDISKSMGIYNDDAGDISYDFDNWRVMATRFDEKTAHLMFINRVIPSSNSSSEKPAVFIDGLPIRSYEIMTIRGLGQGYDDRQLDITFRTPANPPLTPLEVNNANPEFSMPKDAEVHGRVEIPAFSVNIIKSAIPQCPHITAPDNDEEVELDGEVVWETDPNYNYDAFRIRIGTAQGLSDVYDDIQTASPFSLEEAELLEPCSTYFYTITPVVFNSADPNAPPFELTTECEERRFMTPCCDNCIDREFDETTELDAATFNNINFNEVRVTHNSVLIIPADVTLHFCPTGRLIVEPGSSVELSGTLTSCIAEWEGVVLNADNTGVSQFLGFGGNDNSALIENARVGINSELGILDLNSTTFLNNRIGILTNGTAQGQPGGINRIRFCRFIVNDDYSVAVPFDAHCRIFNSRNTYSFLNCFFTNEIAENLPPLNYGIHTMASRVLIFSEGIPTIFNRLTFGIWTGGNTGNFADQTARLVAVYRAKFDHCGVGIFDRSSMGNFWLKNEFHFGQAPLAYLPLLLPTQIGIAAENNCSGFILLDNSFYGASAPQNQTNQPPNVVRTIGTSMANLGAVDNFITYNHFYNLNWANNALGANGILGQDVGLMYDCNDNHENINFDFLADRTLNTTVFPPTIIQPVLRRNQGAEFDPGPPVVFWSAGNCFSNPSIAQFRYNRTDNSNIIYHCTPDVANCTLIPTNINPNVVVDQSNVQEAQCGGYEIFFDFDENRNPPLQLNISEQEVEQNRTAYFDASESLSISTAQQDVSYWTQKRYEYATKGFQISLIKQETFDSIAIWLQRMETFESQLYLAQLFREKGQPTEAANFLNSLNNLTEHQSSEIADLQDIWTIVNSNTLSNSQHVELLLPFAEMEFSYTGALARNALERLGVHYPPILQREESTSRQLKQGEPIELLNLDAGQLLIKPNPASNYLQILLGESLQKFEKRLEIYSAFGDLKKEVQIVSGASVVDIDVSELPSGYYIGRLRQTNVRDIFVKILITKL